MRLCDLCSKMEPESETGVFTLNHCQREIALDKLHRQGRLYSKLLNKGERPLQLGKKSELNSAEIKHGQVFKCRG